MSATPPARRARARLARLTALLAVVLVTVVGLGAPSASATAYPSPAGGTRQVGGYIGVHYQALGGPAGVLGGPLTDELATPSGYGRYNHFAGGSVYWTPATGAWAVGGAIRDSWSRLGWETGPLGYPTSDEGSTQGGRGRYGAVPGRRRLLVGGDRRAPARRRDLEPLRRAGLGGLAPRPADHRRARHPERARPVQPLPGRLGLLVAGQRGARRLRRHPGPLGRRRLGELGPRVPGRRRARRPGRAGADLPAGLDQLDPDRRRRRHRGGAAAGRHAPLATR